MIKMPIEKRSKEERTKSAAKVRKAIYAPGKVPGTFTVDALQTELEIVEIVQEMALEAESEQTNSDYEAEQQDLRDRVDLDDEIEVVQPEIVVEVPEGATVTTSTETPVEDKIPLVISADDAIAIKDRNAEIEALKAKLAELQK